MQPQGAFKLPKKAAASWWFATYHGPRMVSSESGATKEKT